MANLFDVYKVFRPGTTILSDDFNSFQSALVGAFQKLGTTRADNLTGVEEPFSVGTPTAATHAVRKDYYESSVDALSAAAVAGELASQVAAADSSASASANSATASANSATDSLGYYQAAQALNTIMPSGTNNSTMRYNGSNWEETDKLQIDSSGVVKVTNSAGDVVFPTAAGTLALTTDIATNLLPLNNQWTGGNTFTAPTALASTTMVGNVKSYRTDQTQTTLGTSAGGAINGGNTGITSVGNGAGYDNPGNNATSLGNTAGRSDQGGAATAVGYQAGLIGQGASAVAVGDQAGKNSQGDNGLIISSKGSAVNDTTAGHIHIASNEASLDYTNADGWSATDASGKFYIGPTVQKKALTGSVVSTYDTWAEVLRLPMPNGLNTTERWAGIGTLESLAPIGTAYAQEFAINAYPNSTEITGTASAPFGTGLSATGGLGVTTPPQLRVATGTGQTYLSVQVKGEALPAPSSSTVKAFYSWADTIDGGATANHTAIVDQASLRAFGETGALVGLFNAVTGMPAAQQYDSVNGVLMRNQLGTNTDGSSYSFESLVWSSAFLHTTSNGGLGLSNSGFTMHMEVEKEAFDNAVVGNTVVTIGASALGTSLGLVSLTGSTPGYLGFGKGNNETAWSGVTGSTSVDVVTAQEPTVGQTHLNFDFSFTKVGSGYRLDVYVERTLWYTLSSGSVASLSAATLHISGRGGYLHSHVDARIRNVLLINHPVDPYAAANFKVSAVGVGDSNMTLGTLQGPNPASPDRTAINNPLTTGQVDTVGLALANGNTPAPGAISGNVFLNSQMQAKGISVSDTTAGQQRFFDASSPGWGVLPDITSDPNEYQTLETIVNDLLSIARPAGIPAARPNPAILPKWWFCNMGINDVLKRSRTTSPMLNGFSDEDEWVTHLCTTYLTQINRMLATSPDAKVFICSPARCYSAGSNANDYMDVTKFFEINNTLNSKVNAEFTSRITNYSPGRVFFKDMFTSWVADYHVSPVPDPLGFNGVHFNEEGYRQMALGFASIVPQGGESGILRHRLTYDYNDISGI